jgi:hypothetical protein
MTLRLFHILAMNGFPQISIEGCPFLSSVKDAIPPQITSANDCDNRRSQISSAKNPDKEIGVNRKIAEYQRDPGSRISQLITRKTGMFCMDENEN